MIDLFSDDMAMAVETLHAATAIYTASHIVRSLLSRAGWPESGGRLLDPGCGSGAFITEALTMLAPAPGDFASTARLQGWEVHPGAAQHARSAVVVTLIDLGWTKSQATAAAKAIILTKDFVTGAEERTRFKTIAGNPPYLRWPYVPELLRRLYEAAVPPHARGDLAHAFLDAAADLVEPNGTIAFVTADRWLLNPTAGPLRDELGRRLGLAEIARIDAESSFYRPKARKKSTPPRVHPVEILLRPLPAIGTTAITRSAISPDGRPDDHDGPRLADVATVRLAPWLGPEGIFILDPSTAERFAEGETMPVVDVDDIDPATGQLRPGPYRRALLTFRDAEPSPAVRDHLAREMRRMPPRGRGPVQWMPPEQLRPAYPKETLLVPRILKTMRPTRLPPGLQPFNHGLHVIDDRSPGHDLDAIDRSLRDPRTFDWVERFAPRLENGFFSISTGLLRRVPIFA